MSFLSGLKRLPSIIGDAMWQTEPVFRHPSMDMSEQPPPYQVDGIEIPGMIGMTVDKQGNVGTAPPAFRIGDRQVPIDPADQPVEVGRKRTGQRSKFGKFVDAMPGIMAAGIAGAATPNIAGGGPTDIFRAMQAGQDALARRDIMAWQRMQRQEEARRKAIEDEAQADMYKAHADVYRQQAAKPITPPTETVTLPPGAVIVDKQTGKVLASNPSRSGESKPMVLAPGAIVVDPATGKEIANNPKPAATAKDEKPYRKDFTDNQGNVTHVIVNPDGTKQTISLGKIGKESKAGQGNAEMTPGQQIARQRIFSDIETRKQKALADAEKEFSTRAVVKDFNGNPVPADDATKQTALQDLNSKKARIQAAYEAEIRAATGNSGNSPVPPLPAPAPAPGTAAGYLRKFRTTN